MHDTRRQRTGERRRRILVDAEDAGINGAEPICEAKKTRRAKRKNAPLYAEAATRQLDLRIADLIPCSWSAVSLVVLLLVTCLLGLEAVYICQVRYLSRPPQPISMLGVGTIANWFLTCLYMVAATVTVVIYALRRHRLDDYRGRYRFWLVMTFACMVISLGHAVDFSFLGKLVQSSGRWPASWETSPWVMLKISGVLIGLALFLRLVWEVKRCRTTVTVLACSMVCGFMAVFLGRENPFVWGSIPLEMSASALTLVWHELFLMAMVWHMRFVVREVRGEIIVLKTKTTATRSSKRNVASKATTAPSPESEKSREMLRVDRATTEPPPPKINTPPAARPNVTRTANHAKPRLSASSGSPEVLAANGSNTTATTPPETTGKKKLTKAERKALRKKRRIDREEAHYLQLD